MDVAGLLAGAPPHLLLVGTVPEGTLDHAVLPGSPNGLLEALAHQLTHCELSTPGPLEQSTAALRVEVAAQLRANPTLHMDGILNALHLNKAIVDPADFQTDEGFPDVTAVVQCFTSMAADPHTTLTLGMETIQAVAAAHSARDEIFTPEGP